MDYEDIRQIVRISLRKQLKETSRRLRMPPKNFQDFQHKLAAALRSSSAPNSLIVEVLEVESDGHIHEKLWQAWHEIATEIQHGPLTKQEWAEVAPAVVQEAVSYIASSLGYRNADIIAENSAQHIIR